ncbi:MAG: DUF255 domain-containing protein [Fimbriimonas sp.]
MFRPGFNAVSGVLATLCVLALIASILRPLLPPAATNQLNFSEEDFLRRAAHQAIDWQELKAASVAKAKKEKKPILLVIGVVSSGLGQLLDATSFQDDDVARYLNRYFVPIRIDGLQHPEWINAFFPIWRLKLEFLPGLQIWVLTPEGEIVGFIGRTKVNESFDPTAIYSKLIEVNRLWQRIKSGAERPQANIIQRNDIAVLSSQEGSVISPFELFRATVEDGIDPEHGGLPRDGLQQLFPNAWRYMCLTGRMEPLHESLDPILLSPMLDLIDGGFFRVSAAADYQKIEFNKVATEQAEMLLTLSIAAALTGDSLYKFAAGNTYWTLAKTMRAGEWIAASQTEDTPEQPRSERYSFSVRKLRNTLSGSQRSWAADYLGLDVLRNRQMVPYLARRDTLEQPQLEAVLEKLRTKTSGNATLSGIGFLEIEATVGARMVEASRIMGNQAWAKLALSRMDALDRFVGPKGLLRRISQEDSEPGYLGDYVAYADAKLQDYLASGRVVSLEQGMRFLSAIPRRFAGARNGEYRLTERPLLFPNTDLPEIADNFRESCSARLLRLFLAYGRLFEHKAEGTQMLSWANEISNRFALIAGDGGPSAGAFFCASGELVDGMYAITVGPQAQHLANALTRQVPTRFVAAAFGPVRPDLQSRTPGIYIVDGTVSGPFTVDEAAQRLPRTLRLPVAP